MTVTNISNAIMPQQTYAAPASTSNQYTALQSYLGDNAQFPDVDVIAGVITVNTDYMRECIFVQNNPSGSAIAPGAPLQFTSGLFGTTVDACAVGTAARLVAPGYVNGSNATTSTIPAGAFFWAVRKGHSNVLSDGIAIANNVGLAVATTAGQAHTDYTSGPVELFGSVVPSPALTGAASTSQNSFATNTYTIPASSLAVGDTIRIRAATGPIGWGAGTLTLQLLIGSVVINTTGAVTNANNDQYYIDAEVEVLTIGASGTISADGTVIDGVPGTAVPKPFFVASTTLNTTVTQAIAVAATWSSNNGSNTVTLNELTVQKLNSQSVGQRFGVSLASVSGGSPASFRARISCAW